MKTGIGKELVIDITDEFYDAMEKAFSEIGGSVHSFLQKIRHERGNVCAFCETGVALFFGQLLQTELVKREEVFHMRLWIMGIADPQLIPIKACPFCGRWLEDTA